MRKYLLILTGVFILCFAALWLYVESDSFAGRIRPYIVRPLRELLGPGTQVGTVKATLLPLVIEARDLAIPAGRNAESIAVRKLRVYINPLPLLWKHVLIPSVTVLEPRVESTRSAEGTIDISGVVDVLRNNIARRRATAPPTVKISLRKITIRNGNVLFRDTASGAQVMVRALNARVLLRSYGTDGLVRVSSGRIAISIPSYQGFEANLEATGTFKGTELSLRSIEMRSSISRISASGSILAAPNGAINLRVQARFARSGLGAVSSMLGRKRRVPDLQTAAAITGTLGSPRLTGTVMLAHVPIGDIEVSKAHLDYTYADRVLVVTGRDWAFERNGRTLTLGPITVEAGYRDGTVRIIRAALVAADAEVRASGAIASDRGYDLVLSALSRNAGAITKFFFGVDSSGAVSLSGALTGSFGAPVFSGTVSAGPVSMRDTTIHGLNGVVRFENKLLSLEGTTIRQEDSRYLFDGSVRFDGPEPYYEARLRVIRSDVVNMIRLFYKKLPLEMSASGDIVFSGTRKAFRGKGHLDLDAGAAYGESFERGSLDVELNKSRITFPRLVVEKGGGIINGRGWIEFRRGFYGSVESSGVDLSSIDHLRALSLSGTVRMQISSSGSFSKPLVNADAQVPMLSVRGVGIGAAVGKLAIRNAELTASVSLDGGPGRIASLEAALGLKRPYPWTSRAEVLFASESPEIWMQGSDLLSRVRISARARASLSGEIAAPRSLSGSIVLPHLGVLIADHRIENTGDAVVQVMQGAFSVPSMVLAGTGTRLNLSGGFRPGKDIDLALDGEVNLSLLRLFYREVEHGDGTALLHLALRDDWEHPSIEGRVTIRDGMLKIRDVPQKFSGLQGEVVFDGERITTDGLAADVGGGRVNVIGSAQLRNAALLDFSLRAIVEGVTVRYPPGLTATLAGTLYYDGNRESQTLAGEISINEARYEKRIEWKSMLVDITRGISRTKKTDIGWIGETRLNIRFTGSEHILFESNLARIPLKIDVLFRGTVNQIQLLGRVEAREGDLYFRNNTFKVLYASADFVDPNRINPVLDVQTETRVREYRIRLAVSGNADRAVVTFLSDPPLADSDILALLALGRKGEELKGKEGEVGIGESFSFATGKFQDLFESRARSLTGLDRFQVDPYINKSDTPVPRVTVGKEVMEKRLFMTYSSNIGGTTPEQNLRIEYILNRNVSLLGEYDELGQIGADLKFRFEFR